MSDCALCGVDDDGNGEYNDEGIIAIASAISVSASLTSINLSINAIDSKSAKHIAKDIAVSPSLTECDLRYNLFGDIGWCAIFDALLGNPQNKFSKWDLSEQDLWSSADRCCPSLRTNSQLQYKFAKSLEAYMAVSTSLTAVDLKNNWLDADAHQRLRDAVKNRVGFKLHYP